MTDKTTQIRLVRPDGPDRLFAVDHAESLLRMGEANGGWGLPEDGGYEFVGGSVRRKPKKEAKCDSEKKK